MKKYVVSLLLLLCLCFVACSDIKGPDLSPSVPDQPQEWESQDPSLGNCKEHIFDRYEYTLTDGMILSCSACGISEKMANLGPKCTHEITSVVNTAGGTDEICFACGCFLGNSEKSCGSSHEKTIEIEPTFYDVGIKSVSCNRCGFSEIEVIPPTNNGSYVCTMSLQEYADASAEELWECAKSIYEECEAQDGKDTFLYPFADVSTYIQIKQFTLDLVKDEATDYGKAKKIYSWVVENIQYDQNAEFYDLDQVWATKTGVCSQYVQLTHDMLASIGIMSSYVQGYSSYVPWDQNDTVTLPTIFQHVYDTGHAVVSCYVGDQILIMDPTWGVSDSDRYFDMTEEALASYFISVEINFTKIVPDNVDIRNYSDPNHRVGAYLMYLSYGELMKTASTGAFINNFEISFVFPLAGIPEYNLSAQTQYNNSAYRNCVIYNPNGIFFVYLSDGRQVNYTEMLSYLNCENELFGKDVELPVSKYFTVYDDCIYRLQQGVYRLQMLDPKKVEITVPGHINGIPVKSVDLSNLSEHKNLKKLTVGEGIESIVGGETTKLQALEELSLPSSMKYLGMLRTENLSVIEIDKDNPYYMSVDNVVYLRNGSTLVLYPAGKTDKEYNVPVGVESICYVMDNDHIEKIVLPDGIKTLGLFHDLHNLTSLNFPGSLTYIHQILATSLEEIILPDGITVLEGCAMADNIAVKRIVLPANLREMAGDAFVNAYALEEIVISEENEHFKTVDGVLYTKDGTKLLLYPISKQGEAFVIPEGVEILATDAFALNKNLKEVSLPSTLRILGMSAFNTTAIESIDLKNVEYIGGACFAGCTNLKSVLIPATVKEMEAQIFYDSSVEYIIIENPNLITEKTAFLRADELKIFLTYENLTEKEQAWSAFVEGVYPQSMWEYKNGNPLVKK